MSTIQQVLKYKRTRKIKWTPSVKLKRCPFKQGIVAVVYTDSPKKPNSGKRKLVKVVLSTGKRAIVTIPDGQVGGHPLQKYNRVLVRGGRAQDMPGAHYKVLRSSNKRTNDTMKGSVNRKQRRSKFGVPKKLF
jgi:small subunit ribosomal protein S12